MMQDLGNIGFLVGAAIALFGAVIHWIAPILGVDYYASLGSPRWVVESARNRTWQAPAGAIVIGALMFACALYALAGMGKTVPYLPLVKMAIVTIATLCLVRGLLIIPILIRDPRMFTPFHVIAALVWFVAGLGFAIGAYQNWARIS